jgi:hypothetical protein
MPDKSAVPDRRHDVARILDELIPKVEALQDSISETDPREADVSRVLDVMQYLQRKLTPILDDHSLVLAVQVTRILDQEATLRNIVEQWQRNEEIDTHEVIVCDDALRELYRTIESLTA